MATSVHAIAMPPPDLSSLHSGPSLFAIVHPKHVSAGISAQEKLFLQGQLGLVAQDLSLLIQNQTPFIDLMAHAIDKLKQARSIVDSQDELFGKIRTPNDPRRTPRMSETILSSWPHHSQDDPHIAWSHFSPPSVNGMSSLYLVGHLSSNENIRLTEHQISYQQGELVEGWYAPTHPSQFPKIIGECDSLLQEIVQTRHLRSNGDDLKSLIYQLHWWMVQAHFYHKGSEVAAQLIVAACALAKGVSFPESTMEFDADAIALTYSLDDYVSNVI